MCGVQATRVALKRYSEVDSMQINERTRQNIGAELEQCYKLVHPNVVRI